MISIAIPLLVCLLGALVYALATGKVSWLGLVAFAVGLFWTIYAVSGATLHLGR